MDDFVITIGKNSFKLKADQSILEALRAAGVSITAPCGGRGACGKCRIRVVEGSLPATDADCNIFTKAEIDAGMRLACMAFPKMDVSLEILGHKEDIFKSLDSFESFGIKPDKYSGNADAPYGIAIDIGTTTLGLCMVSLKTGEIAGRWSSVNKQREYGADVVTRIERATKGDLAAMRDSIRSQLSEGINSLFDSCDSRDKELTRIVIAGNTTMLHLLLGLECSTLGVFPFTPVTLEEATYKYNELFAGPFECDVYILPGIATYVGADVSAGIMYSGLHRSERPVLLVDIGTNGEMAVGCRDGIVCTSTAAGPAFEGANIKWGTGSIPGAISSVVYDGGRFKCETIDNAPPVGICGSGILDAAFQAVKHNLVSSQGRIDKLFTKRELPIANTNEGDCIALTQKDIRELQLGKSAISSGINILLEYAGINIDEINALYLAGGFGCHLRPESAFGIGMLPEQLMGKTQPLGNSSLGGAVYTLLKESACDELEWIISNTKEFSLSERKEFNQLFLENTSFKRVG